MSLDPISSQSPKFQLLSLLEKNFQYMNGGAQIFNLHWTMESSYAMLSHTGTEIVNGSRMIIQKRHWLGNSQVTEYKKFAGR